jgi:hypothetical protein
MLNYTRNEWRRCQNTLETSGKFVKPFLNLKAEGLMYLSNLGGLRVKLSPSNYTRNGWRRSNTTLETSGEDEKKKLETGGEDRKPHSKVEKTRKINSKRGGKMQNYTRNEWRRCKRTHKSNVWNYTFPGLLLSFSRP